MGRIIVITGGTSGIGLALKDLFEKNGDTVLTFSLLENGESNHYSGSVDHEIKVRQVFNDVHERYGNIDMLINCAGIGMSGVTEVAELEEIKKVMDVNFYGTLYCMRSALGYMKEGSRIVNLSSAMALFPVPFRSVYGAAKSAVLNLSMAMRMELAPAGIDVTAICPGDTKTNFTASRIKSAETNEKYGDRMQIATENSDSREDKRMTAEFVAEKIFKLINKPKTKPFYIIGGKYKFLYFLTRFTPKSLLISCTNKKLGGLTKKNAPKKTKVAKVEQPKDVEQAQEVAIAEDENKEAVETVVAEVMQEEVSTTQEQKPNTLNNLLSKITIMNKPAASNESKAEETSSQEVVQQQESVETSKIEDNTNPNVE